MTLTKDKISNQMTSATSSSRTKNKATSNVRRNTKKFWVLVLLEVICVIGVVKFFFVALDNGLFTFTEVWESAMKVLGYAFIFSGLQYGFKTLARPILYWIYPSKTNKTPARLDRTAVALFKLTYNLIIFYMWQNVLQHEEDNGALWPKAVPHFWRDGWNGLKYSSTNQTEEEIKVVNDIWSHDSVVSGPTRSLFLLIIGYLMAELILLLPEYNTNRSDYLEMLLHHTIASSITFFTYVCDFMKIAALVMYVHNASDVFIYISRSTIDMKKYGKLVIGIAFLFLCISFFWYRLCVFPLILLRSCWNDSYPFMLSKFKNDTDAASIAWFYFNSSMSILFTLNCYWWLLILRVGLAFIQTGRPRDVAVLPGATIEAIGKTGIGLQMTGNISPGDLSASDGEASVLSGCSGQNLERFRKRISPTRQSNTPKKTTTPKKK